MNANECLAAKPEFFRPLLDDVEMLAVSAPKSAWMREIMRETLLMIRYGREAFKFWDCV